MRQRLYIYCMVLLIAVGCSKDATVSTIENLSGEVSLCSSISTRVSGRSWDAGDCIGVYMCDGATPLLSNYEYTAVADGETTMFNYVSSSEILYYPSQIKPDFVAYYPYDSELTSEGKIEVSTTDQSDQEAIDLLYSNNLQDVTKSSSAQELSFSHLMSKVSFSIVLGDGLYAERLAGATITMSGLVLSGECDLLTPSLLNSQRIALSGSSTSTLSLKQSSVGGEYNDRAEAIVIPQSREGVKVTIALSSGLSFTASIPYDTTSAYFSTGTSYLYTLEISDSKAEIISSSIKDWVSGSDYNESGQASVYEVHTFAELNAMGDSTEILSDTFAITDSEATRSDMTMLGELLDGDNREFEIYFLNATTFESLTAASSYTNNVRLISAPCATSIGDYAFSSFTGLEDLSLPMVTYIGTEAFKSESFTNMAIATGITEQGSGLTVGTTPFPTQDNAVTFTTNGLSSTKMTYDDTTYAVWTDVNDAEIVKIKDDGSSITITSPYVYEYVPNLAKYLDPSCVVAGVTTLEFVNEEVYEKDDTNIDHLCEQIGNYVEFEFPNLTTIHRYDFDGLTALTSFSAPNADTIWQYAFSGCTSLKRLYVPSVYYIGDYSLNNCSSLDDLTYGKVNSVGISAFKGCSKLTSLEFPYLSTLTRYLFSGCTALNYVSVGVNTSSLVVDPTAFCIPVEGYVDVDSTPNITTPLDCSQITLYTNLSNGCMVNDDFTLLSAATSSSDLEALSEIATFKEILVSDSYTFGGLPDNFNSEPTSTIILIITDTVETTSSSFANLANTVGNTPNKMFKIYLPNLTTMTSNNVMDGFDNISLIRAPNLLTLPTYAFRLMDGLDELYFPKVTQVQYQGLSYNYNLTKLTLGELTLVDAYGFEHLESLTTENLDCTFADSFTTIHTSAFKDSQKLKINEKFDLSKITTISATAFQRSGIKGDVDFSECASIGANAFESSFITSFTATKCTSAGDYAFLSCHSLTTAKVGFESCGKYLFQDCTALESVEFTASSITFGADMFSGATNLKTITFSGITELTQDNVSDIESLVTGDELSKYGLSEDVEILFPNLTVIAESAFENYTSRYFCEDTESRLANVESIGDNAFQNSNFTTLDLPSVTSLSYNALYDDNTASTITSVSLPALESVSTNGLYFYFPNCTTLSLPKLTTMNNFTFGSYIINTLETLDLSSVRDLNFTSNTNNNSTYKLFSQASNLTELDIRSLREIPEGCCYSALKLATLHIAGVEGDSFSVGASSFYNCVALVTVDAPYLTTIESHGFYGCGALTSLSFANLLEIGSSAFYQCSALASFSANNVTTINSYGFRECKKLAEVTMGNIKVIGDYAFYNCNSLNEFSFDLVESIGSYVFTYTNITEIIAPNLTTVGNSAFSYCDALSVIEMPVLTSMGSSLFYDNFGIISKLVLCTDSVPESWYSTAFSGLKFDENSVIQYSNGYLSGSDSKSRLYLTKASGSSFDSGVYAPTSCFTEL